LSSNPYFYLPPPSIPYPLLILLLSVKFSVFVADERPQELLGGKFGIIGELNGDADSGQRLAYEVSLRHAGGERIQLHALDDVGVVLTEEEFSGAADGTTLQVGFVVVLRNNFQSNFLKIESINLAPISLAYNADNSAQPRP